MTDGLSLRLLGPPAATLDGVPVEVDTRKATALLAYLAMEPRLHARDQIAALLWPEYDQSRAHGALRRTLSTLRSALGGRFVTADRSAVRIERAGLTLDVDLFRLEAQGCGAHDPGEPCAACAAPLSAAADRFGGGFMAGFTLRDSTEFDDWHYAQASALQRESAVVLERLVKALTADGRLRPALDAARRWLATDELHEPAHRTLIDLHTMLGERSAAIRQYRECVAVLDRELGVAPLDETTTAYRRAMEAGEGAVEAPAAPVRAGGSRGRPPQASPPSAVPPRSLPFVGRTTELDRLRELHARAGDGSLVLVEGEAGIGKTRLVEEFLAGVPSERLVGVRCHEDEAALAFAPLVPALRTILAGGRAIPPNVASELGRLLPELEAATAQPIESPAARTRFFEAICTFVLDALGGHPAGCLFVDDLQWADQATVELLTYLCRRLAGRGLLVVGALRPEDAAGREALDGLVTGAVAVRLVLPRLGHDEVDTLVSSLGRAEDGLSDRIYETTEGLPLLIAETLLGQAEPGARSLADIVAGRLARTSQTARQVLSAAAIIGRSFDVDVVREASGRTDDETAAALDELTAHGFVREAAGTYDFVHEQIRAVAVSDTGLARRRLLHRRVANAFLSQARSAGREPPHALVGYHLASAGAEHESARHYRLAGDRALALLAVSEAAGHFESALAYGDDDPSTLHELLGDIHTLTGRYDDAIAAFEAAAAIGRPPDASRLERKIAAVHTRRGDWTSAYAHLDAALELAGSDADRARIVADRGLVAHRSGSHDGAAARAAQALGLAIAAGDETGQARAHNLAGTVASSAGDHDDAVFHLSESLRLSESAGDDESRIAALNSLARAQSAAGRHEVAIEAARQGLALCAAIGDLHLEAAMHSNLADVLHAAGRSEDAKPHQLRSVELFAQVQAAAGRLRPEIWMLAEW